MKIIHIYNFTLKKWGRKEWENSEENDTKFNMMSLLVEKKLYVTTTKERETKIKGNKRLENVSLNP